MRVKTFKVLQIIYISNKCCSFELFIKNPENIYYKYIKRENRCFKLQWYLTIDRRLTDLRLFSGSGVKHLLLGIMCQITRNLKSVFLVLTYRFSNPTKWLYVKKGVD